MSTELAVRRIWQVKIRGPRGSEDWLQASGATVSDALAAVSAAVMPGVEIVATEEVS